MQYECVSSRAKRVPLPNGMYLSRFHSYCHADAVQAGLRGPHQPRQSSTPTPTHHPGNDAGPYYDRPSRDRRPSSPSNVFHVPRTRAPHPDPHPHTHARGGSSLESPCSHSSLLISLSSTFPTEGLFVNTQRVRCIHSIHSEEHSHNFGQSRGESPDSVSASGAIDLVQPTQCDRYTHRLTGSTAGR